MELKYLTSDDIKNYWSEMNQLMHICCESGEDVPIDESFYEDKLTGLEDYIRQGKAYIIGAIEDGRLHGFYWIYELGEGVRRRMHVAYCAVMPDSRRRGIFNRLEVEAQRKALELGISVMERYVSPKNTSVIQIHEKSHGYSITDVIMKKIIQPSLE